MSFISKSVSILGKLFAVGSLLLVFAVGLVYVFYVQLKGEEVTIPKIVGKDFNEGKEDLFNSGLRIKRIAKRYSKEDPNTIIEQRPRAGSTAKTGLTISVVVADQNSDGYEEPVEVKDDDEAIEEIEDQPELKIEKPKKKRSTQPKKKKKTRDVVTPKVEEKSVDENASKADSKKTTEGKKTDDKKAVPKPPVDKEKPKKPGVKKTPAPKPKKPTDTRKKRVIKSN